MKLITTMIAFDGSRIYHFRYSVLKPRDKYEELYPYRHWNIVAKTTFQTTIKKT